MDNLITKTEKNSPESDLSLLLHSSKGAKSRKRILNKLLYGSKSCNHIATDLGLNWRTAYRHLQILEKESLVKSFDFGQRKVYKLTLKGEEVIKSSIKSENVSPNVKKEDAQGECCLNDTEKSVPRLH